MIRVTQKTIRKTLVTERGYTHNPDHKEIYKITTVWLIFIPIFVFKHLVSSTI